MQVQERRVDTAGSRLNRRTVLCVVALALAETRPLREQMEQRRLIHANETPVATKQELGQYFTPGHIADFMASFFPRNDCAGRTHRRRAVGCRFACRESV